MKNPLEEFVEVEERPDGVYIKVAPAAGGSIDTAKLKRALDNAQVTNYNFDQIKEVVAGASGEFEKIGHPFDYYNPQLDKYVEVNITDRKATMKIDSLCIADNVRPTLDSVVYLLKRSGIRYGLKTDNIRNAVNALKYDVQIDVAEAKEPLDGRNAVVEYQVDLNPDTKPQKRSDGSVDFRNIQTFVQIPKDQVIAKKIPPTPGEPGITVKGEEIPANPGKDIDLPGGQNTHLSEDGQYLLSSISGVIQQEGALINVREELIIAKDVDYRVGNIKHSGNLVIKGDIKPGFNVTAEGDITIMGIVESAEVNSRNGTVTINRGVIGKGDASIFGKKGVRVSFAQESTLETEGVLQIDKYCLHCKCKCNVLEAKERGTSIVGGNIRAFQNMTVYQLGNENSVETLVSIVDKNKEIVEQKLKELAVLEKTIQEKLSPIEKQVKSKAAILKQSRGKVTDRQKQEMVKWINAYNELNSKLEYVKKTMGGLKAQTKESCDYKGYIKVAGDAFPGVKISLYDKPKALAVRMTDKTFRLIENAVQC